ncbi:MAG: hypothetical protein ABIG55_03035 [Candidatus Omnitrophota bacterium]|nr:hypothetical protein [Candidatus Omnitrophota bacterium]
MDKYIGIWIDHEKAFVITLLDDNKSSLKKIESNVEPHFRLSGGYRSVSSSGTSAVSERKPEERHKHQLHNYFQELIQNVKMAKEIFIFGPGEAKTEFAKEMKKVKDLEGKIRAVEPSDKLTDKQIIAKVKKYFSK